MDMRYQAGDWICIVEQTRSTSKWCDSAADLQNGYPRIKKPRFN
uniref:Uncharacterized protein n=1 Tax=uncultured bacterium A1Q1_fos_291 TaxID=1256570 RepID=L7VWU8_9BACT|nr:hypothetical protein [uncultured bacterium A1Q1_fos_291]